MVTIYCHALCIQNVITGTYLSLSPESVMHISFLSCMSHKRNMELYIHSHIQYMQIHNSEKHINVDTKCWMIHLNSTGSISYNITDSLTTTVSKHYIADIIRATHKI